MKHATFSIADLMLLIAGSEVQAQTIELEPFSGKVFC